MPSFSEQLQTRLERHLKDRRILVFYDPREEFTPLIEGLEPVDQDPSVVRVGATPTWVCRFQGSYLELRNRVEDRLASGTQRAGLIYVPGAERDRSHSPLMEFELAGESYEPQLRRLARDILRDRYSDGQIDELLDAPGVAFSDIERFYNGSDEAGGRSLLRLVFGGLDSEPLLVAFLTSPERDEELESKGGRPELLALIDSRLGLNLSDETELSRIRTSLFRFVLINEFRMDLDGPAPSELEMVPAPTLKEQRERIRTVTQRLRRTAADRYEEWADQIEEDLGLAALDVDAERLGSVDTFRFEERLLLRYGAGMLEKGSYEDAAGVAAARQHSHWVVGDPLRSAQWNALERAADLGRRLASCVGELKGFKGRPPRAWIERYTAPDGWHVLDGLHRELGRSVHSMDQPPECAKGVRKVQAAYSDWVRALTEGFAEVLEAADWDAGWELHQTQIFDELLATHHDPVALLLVDALRYELGVELSRRLRQMDTLKLSAAVAALPTITSVGMAALLPGAATSFSVRASGSGIAGAIDDVDFPNLDARRQHLQARVPDAVDFTLGKLQRISDSDLAKAVDGASLIVVRSQDIDAFGEAGAADLMEQAISGILPNLAQTILRLGAAGVRRFVVTADHGYLVDSRQGDDMKLEAPDGDQVDLHRRCWAGRGGKTPAGAVRVSGDRLGYDTDLDFIFPAGRGVFRAGGDLQYHHGGLSLQELVIPVIEGTVAAPADEQSDQAKVEIVKCPPAITNRIIVVEVRLASDLFAEPQKVQVTLMAGREQIGEAALAQEAGYDKLTKTVELSPGKTATVGVRLDRDDVSDARLTILDAETGAMLAQSKSLKLKLTH